MDKDFEETKCDGFKWLSLQNTNSNFFFYMILQLIKF